MSNLKHKALAAAWVWAMAALPGTLYADAVRPDAHGPIGVMREHTHKEGEWMLAYRYMHMSMGGNRAGTDRVSVQETIRLRNRFGEQRIVPTEMSMEMHMFGAMYALSDRWTLAAMGSWRVLDMHHQVYTPSRDLLGSFDVRTSGPGDVHVSMMHDVYNSPTGNAQFNMGVRIPTASITKRHQIYTPMGTRPTVRVPYAMQLGSGTFDLLPGAVYSGHRDRLGWGLQYAAQLRMGTNDEGYSLGDEHALSAWGSYRLRPWVSTSLRLHGQHQGRISGMDRNITGVVQTADPHNYGGRRLNLALGLNLAGGVLHHHRLAVEVTWPFYQDLNGLQMETDFAVTAGWQYAWGP